MTSRSVALGWLSIFAAVVCHATQPLAPATVGIGHGESTIVVSPTPTPPIEVRRRLAAWRRGYESGMAPVEASWNAVLDSMYSDRAWHLTTRCARFAAEMEHLDLSQLGPAPNPVVDLHLRALLDHLSAAAEVCSRERFFATEYRLGEATAVRRQLEALLRRYLGPGD